jgi:hypothetical protein
MKTLTTLTKDLVNRWVLVGALVLGTAFPHLLNNGAFPWKVILTTSSLALLGGLMIVFLVPNGPYRKQSRH